MVGIDTGMAYHPVPVGTVLYQRFPDAWMMSSVAKGGALTSSPLPADAVTAAALLVYLHEQRGRGSISELIEQYVARAEGHWVSL